MSSTVAIPLRGSLDELAETVNREHALCEQGMRAGLAHAISAGVALAEARSQLAYGEWGPWLRANCTVTESRANVYIRLTHYRDHLDDAMSVREAQAALAGLPRTRSMGPPPVVTSAVIARATALVKDEGLSINAAAKQLDISRHLVARHVHPERTLKRRREESKNRYKAKMALKRQEREREIKRAVRKAGAALAEAYSMAERMGGVLAQAEQEASGVEALAALTRATEYHHKMRDEIVRALGVA